MYKCPPAQSTFLGLCKNSLSLIILKSNLTCFAGAFQEAGLYTSPVCLSINAVTLPALYSLRPLNVSNCRLKTL